MEPSRGYGTAADEESSRNSPLCTSNRPPARPHARPHARPPFPTRQMLVLALCRFCEPIASTSIFPYIYFMIEDLHVTDDPSKISLYAGLVTSAFPLAQFSTGILWGRLSDKVGRKPILLSGLAGTGLSVLVFGVAPNLPVAILARALGGLLNGNLGVFQTTVAETITVKEHQPRGYSIMPFVWCLGSILGPMIGATLANPCISSPVLFPPGSIWDRFPYLLPNIVVAAIVSASVCIGFLFLKEAHSLKMNRRDVGIEMGNVVSQLFTRASRLLMRQGKTQKPSLLTASEPHPGYRPNVESPQLPPLPEVETESTPLLLPATQPLRVQTGKTFTPPVILIIVLYGITAFYTMTFDQTMLVFLSSKPPQHPPPVRLPFKFVGGFGMSTQELGVILSIQGIYSLISVVFFFPLAAKRLPALRLFQFTAFTYVILLAFTPYVALLPARYQLASLYIIVLCRCTLHMTAFPSIAILLANAAPSLLVLGTINGVSASAACFGRAIGPMVSGYLYSLGLQTGYLGLTWWFSCLVATGNALLSLRLSTTHDRLAI